MFKDRLQDALDRNNMKAIELAERLNVSRGTISQYLSGKFVPRGDRLHKIAVILNVNEAWLLEYDDRIERSSITSSQADEIIKTIRSLSPERQRLALSLLQTLIDSDNPKTD